MPLATFKIGKKEYVIIARWRYRQLIRIEQDQMDAEVARKGIEAYRSGKEKPIPLDEMRRRLGL